MKKILHCLIFVWMCLPALFVSCNIDDGLPATELQLQSPYNAQWKLVAFGEVSQSDGTTSYNTVKKNILPDNAAAYTIAFKLDGTFSGRSSANSINGTYSIQEARGILSIDDEIVTTKLVETGDGNAYMNALRSVKYYSVIYKDREKYLRLFYPEGRRYYLEYKEIP